MIKNLNEDFYSFTSVSSFLSFVKIKKGTKHFKKSLLEKQILVAAGYHKYVLPLVNKQKEEKKVQFDYN